MITHLLVSMMLVFTTVVATVTFIYFSFLDKGKTDLMIEKQMINAYRPDLDIKRLAPSDKKGQRQYLTIVLSFAMTVLLAFSSFLYIQKHFTGGETKEIEGLIADKNITQHSYQIPRLPSIVNNEYFISLQDGTKLVTDFVTYNDVEIGEVYSFTYYKNSMEIESHSIK